MTNKSILLQFMPAAALVHASNIRQASSPQEDAEMRASILAQNGVQQNLIAAPRKTDGKIAVFAGGRRLSCTHDLINEGKLPQDFELPVMVRQDMDPDSPEAIELALTENVVRASMDYIDECNAMMMLSAAGRSDDDIASSFDYRPRTVRERLLIASLAPEAQDLVRSKERNLEWARALTIADRAMQAKICEDISANGNAWKTGDDIRNYLTKSTIPAEHALFDPADYDGIIVSDFFEGDKYADTDLFWKLQNEAISERMAGLEAEGYAGVQAIYEPFEAWRFEEEADVSNALAIIEVQPNGKVTEHKGVRVIATEGDASADLNIEMAQGDHGDEIAPFEVRPTQRLLEYASAQRSAMLQSHLAGSFRASMEYTILALLGARSSSFGASQYLFGGDEAYQTGKAFNDRMDITRSINDFVGGSLDEADAEIREGMQVQIVRSMDEDQLKQLFAMLVSQRVGQNKRSHLDAGDTALSNIFGQGIDIRSMWTPNAIFFDLMSTEDMRRLVGALVPGITAVRIASAKRKSLIGLLVSAFENARDGVHAGPEAERLNSWVPGILSFPAQIAKVSDLENHVFETEEDLAASIFEDVDA